MFCQNRPAYRIGVGRQPAQQDFARAFVRREAIALGSIQAIVGRMRQILVRVGTVA